MIRSESLQHGRHCCGVEQRRLLLLASARKQERRVARKARREESSSALSLFLKETLHAAEIPQLDALVCACGGGVVCDGGIQRDEAFFVVNLCAAQRFAF